MAPLRPLQVLERRIRRFPLFLLKFLLPAPRAVKAPPRHPKDILLLRVDRVGDMIVSTPAIHAIRLRFPEARITVLAARGNAGVLWGNPDVNEVWTLSRKGLLKLLLRLRSRHWDVAVDLNAAPSLTSGALTRWADAGARVSFDKPDAELFYDVRLPTDEKAHRARETMKAAAWLGAAETDLAYRVYPGRHDESLAREALAAAGWKEGETWLAAHPGNIKKFDNRWPEDKFAELLDRVISASRAKVLLLKGPDEDALISDVLSLMKNRPPTAPALPLLAMGALLKRMSLVLCNSTSTMHLAAAVGTPTLSFLGGYMVACWKPEGPKHRALESRQWGSCRDITVDEAWKALREML